MAAQRPSAGGANDPTARRTAALAALRWRGLGQGGLATAAVALGWALVLAGAAGGPPETARSLGFIGGPFVLLAGLHARLAGYLHSRQRIELLPRPLTAAEHWRLALRRHRRGLLWPALLGAAAVGLGLGTAGSAPQALGVLGDLAWLLVLAALVEPLVAALAAYYGRRFAAESRAAELQRSLSGGWTPAEATVHLYAPALGIAAAAALAMPGQLALELRGATVESLPLLLVPLALAVVGRLVAPRLYGVGVWEATPRLHEAVRTLAGPPRPAAAPGWSAGLAALQRLDLLQLLRLRALLWVRLAAVAGVAAWIAARGATPGPTQLAIGLLAVALWAPPFLAVARQRRLRARLLGALPLPAAQRRGHMGAAALAFALLPPAALLGVVVARSLAAT
ncbi:MAG: hypothetical protein R3A79_25585 [Nannocystaceae bacterium]